MLVGQGGRDKEGRKSSQDKLKRKGQVRADPEEHMERRGRKRQVGQYKRDREGGMDNVYAVRAKKTGRTAQAEKTGRTGQVGQDWLVTGKEGQIRRMEQVGEGRHTERGSRGMGDREGGAGGQSRWDMGR